MWFQDEARVGPHGALTRLWAARGSRPRFRRDRRFTWAYLFGAICPARGTGAAVVMAYVGVEAMNRHLIEISATVSPGAAALLIMDGAGWHRSNQLIVPDTIVAQVSISGDWYHATNLLRRDEPGLAPRRRHASSCP